MTTTLIIDYFSGKPPKWGCLREKAEHMTEENKAKGVGFFFILELKVLRGSKCILLLPKWMLGS